MSASRSTLTLLTALPLALALGVVATPRAHAAGADTAGPTVTTTYRDPDTNGWYRGAVPFRIEASDPSGLDESSAVTLSGAETGTTSLDDRFNVYAPILSHQGATTVFWHVLDRAGNATSGSQVFRIDTVGPVITPTGTPDGAVLVQGADAPVQMSVGDATSGWAGGGVTGDVLPGVFAVDTRTPGDKTVVFSGHDVAGNTTSVTRTYHVVAHGAPVTVVTTSPQPNGAGWFDFPPVVHVHADPGEPGSSVARISWDVDAQHGQVDSSDADTAQVVDGVSTVVAHAVDTEGVTGPDARLEVRVDSVAPVVAADVQVGTLYVGQHRQPGFHCSDALSGVAACSVSGDVVDGELDTSTPGDRSFTVTAVDVAGNRSTATGSFHVTPLPTPGTVSLSAPRRVSSRDRAVVDVAYTWTAESHQAGVVRILDGDRVVATATPADGDTGVPLAPEHLRVTLPPLAPGVHHLHAVLAADRFSDAVSTVVGLAVQSPTRLRPGAVVHGRNVVAQIVVTARGTTPSGRVRVIDGRRVVGSARIVEGVAVVRLRHVAAGRHRLMMVYAGSATTLPSTARLTVRVLR